MTENCCGWTGIIALNCIEHDLAYRVAADEKVQASELGHAAVGARSSLWRQVHDMMCDNSIKVAGLDVSELQPCYKYQTASTMVLQQGTGATTAANLCAAADDSFLTATRTCRIQHRSGAAAGAVRRCISRHLYSACVSSGVSMRHSCAAVCEDAMDVCFYNIALHALSPVMSSFLLASAANAPSMTGSSSTVFGHSAGVMPSGAISRCWS